jgi:hypothetical protein
MRRYFAFAAVAATITLLPIHTGNAMTVGTASGIQQSLVTTSAIEKVVRVCRHRFWTSKRVCYVDRSRPPTVCHHLRNSSRRDCY